MICKSSGRGRLRSLRARRKLQNEPAIFLKTKQIRLPLMQITIGWRSGSLFFIWMSKDNRRFLRTELKIHDLRHRKILGPEAGPYVGSLGGINSISGSQRIELRRRGPTRLASRASRAAAGSRLNR